MSKGENNDLFGGIDFNSLGGAEDSLIDLSKVTSEDNDENEENNEDDDSNNEDSSLIDLSSVDDNGDEDSEDEGADGNEDDDDGRSSSPFFTLAEALHEKGLLSSFDEKAFQDALKETGDETEALIALVNQEIDSRANFIENSLTPAQKEYLEALVAGVPDNIFAEAKLLKKSYSEITVDELEDDLDKQAEIYKAYLEKTTKFSPEKIARLIESKKYNDDLLEDAKEGLEYLKEIDKVMIEEAKINAAKEKERKQQEAELFMEQLKDKVASTTEIIPGIKIPKNLQDTIYQNMTKAAGKDKHGNFVNNIALAREEDPVGFEIKLQYLFTMTNGFKDFSKLVAPVKTSATNKLKESLERDNSWTASLPKGKNKTEGDGSTKSIIRSLKL